MRIIYTLNYLKIGSGQILPSVTIMTRMRRVEPMAVNLSRVVTGAMNINPGHERTSKAGITHKIQLIRGITDIHNQHLLPLYLALGQADYRGNALGSDWGILKFATN